MFDSVVIYNYGYSQLGLTYDVPVKFFFNNKEIATFHLYSFYSDLESGVYDDFGKYIKHTEKEAKKILPTLNLSEKLPL